MPRGLDRSRPYRVTFDSTGESATVDGWALVHQGIPVHLESVLSSEILLFEEAG
jgi:hypothetical protein